MFETASEANAEFRSECDFYVNKIKADGRIYNESDNNNNEKRNLIVAETYIK